MNAVEIFVEAARSVGYREEAIVPDYTFADVFDPACRARTVSVAAFAQTPLSCRSAAFAAVPAGAGDPQAFADGHRALGAPALFVIEGDHTSLWEIRGSGPSRRRERLPVQAVPRLFERDRDRWRPDRIHRAKSIGAVEPGYRLDFIDTGLLPAVEGEIHVKLGRLLLDTLAAASRPAYDGDALSSRDLFRLLAGKVLSDRGHAMALGWRADDPDSVLRSIESCYDLDREFAEQAPSRPESVAAARDVLRHGIDVANIPPESLAYIYGEILAGPATGWRPGSHGAPRQLADYAVARLQLHRHDRDSLQVYEPFAGVAPFLVSAIRHLRDLLPAEWSDEERHEFLIDRIRGDGVGAAAREAAVLSLMLADYPNRNGWRIGEIAPFDGEFPASRMSGANVILCNPPFGNSAWRDTARHPIPGNQFSRPAVALDAALAARPAALAFVLPHAFVRAREFLPQRKKVERLYGDIEIVDLPETITLQSGHSGSASALLVAHTPEPHNRSLVSLRSTEIAPGNCGVFLKSGKVTAERSIRRAPEAPSGNLWIPMLHSVWEHLAALPTLNDSFEMRRGIQWKTGADPVWGREERPGCRQGLHTLREVTQFAPAKSPVYLDVRAENLPGNAIDLPWERPKLIVNAGGLGRGPWRVAAMPDERGLLLSRKFIGLWPRSSLSDSELLAFAAILNGPVANAFLATRDPAERIRIADIRRVPVPPANLFGIGELVARYVSCLTGGTTSGKDSERTARLLTEIDALVLGAYDLPARLEKQLLGYFRGAKRPVAHTWRHWDETHPMPGLTLAERLSGRYRPHGSWILDVFRPLPEDEARILREYVAQ